MSRDLPVSSISCDGTKGECIIKSIFEYEFTVDAPLSAVREFHHDTRALKVLTPPPMLAQIHTFEPMADGSLADFTLWLGPLPIRWVAVHSGVDDTGFTDTQVHGPMKLWRHTHRFTLLSDRRTQIREHIEYEHDEGLRGLLTRLLFSKPGLTYLFAMRKRITIAKLRQPAVAAVRSST